jgi:aminoglycoside 6-adenylyltransferase
VRGELERTYVGTDVDENWDALFATIELFRRVAKEVAAALGIAYPQNVDDGVTALVSKLRS